MGAIRHELAFPEVEAGGFSRIDGTVGFYNRVNALLRPSDIVLDFGAGRGAALHDDAVTYRRQLRNLKDKVSRVVGVDVDPAVTSNPGLHEAHVIDPTDRLPLDNAAANLILADFVFEHLADPNHWAREFDRVLRPSGWICARTPNRWGYVALAARLIPKSMQGAVLQKLQPYRKAEDAFPTVYALNSRRQIRNCFPPERYLDVSYIHTAEPSYIPARPMLIRAVHRLERLLPDALGVCLFVFLQKR